MNHKEQKEALLTFFKATGQPERLRILGLLAERPYTIPELAVTLRLKETAVTHHLRALQTAGLVAQQKEVQPPTFYFTASGLHVLQNIIEGNVIPEDLEARVRREYVINGRLQAIPRQPEEQAVILRWMAEKFEPERRYTETEVTDLVQQYCDQPLMLRRILADHHFLRQTGRQYWRPLAEHFSQD
jgi:DNA-binding HxlR family transcriptional regulator